MRFLAALRSSCVTIAIVETACEVTLNLEPLGPL